MNERSKKQLGIGIAAIILIIIVLSFSGIKIPFYAAGGSAFSNRFQCTLYNNTYCGTQQNGFITSLSQIQTSSNFLGQSVWLVNFALNRGGQFLVGTWTSTQIAGVYNATTSNPQAISIQANLTKEYLNIPYVYSGTEVWAWSYQNITISYQGTMPSGLFAGANCLQSNQTSSYYWIACSGVNAASYVINALNGYINACNANNGQVFYMQSIQNVLGLGYQVDCLKPSTSDLYSLWQSGNPTLGVNASVTYTQAGIPQMIYLTASNPENNIGSTLYAQIYGYLAGSGSTYIGATAPSVVCSRIGFRCYVVPHASVYTIQQLSQSQANPLNPTTFPSGWLSPSAVNIYGTPLPGIKDFPTLKNAALSQFSSAVGVASQTLPVGDSFYRMRYNLSSSIGNLSITNNPAYYPQIQFLASVSTLALAAYQINPQIQSVSPNPLTATSGTPTSATFTVINTAGVGGSAYIYGTCGNSQISVPSFYVPGNGAPVTVGVTINPPLTNITTIVNCVAYAKSTQGSYTSPAFTFTMNIAGLPGPTSTTTVCPPNLINATTGACNGGGGGNGCTLGQLNIGLGCQPVYYYVIGIILIIAIIYLVRKGAQIPKLDTKTWLLIGGVLIGLYLIITGSIIYVIVLAILYVIILGLKKGSIAGLLK